MKGDEDIDLYVITYTFWKIYNTCIARVFNNAGLEKKRCPVVQDKSRPLVNFPKGQAVAVHSHLLNEQGIRQVVC